MRAMIGAAPARSTTRGASRQSALPAEEPWRGTYCYEENDRSRTLGSVAQMKSFAAVPGYLTNNAAAFCSSKPRVSV